MPLTKQDLLHRFLTALWLTPLIVIPYALTGRMELRPVLWLQPGPFENRIPIDTQIAPWVYITYYPLLYLIGILVSNQTFPRYIFALAVTSIISALVFLLIPSGVPRESVDLESASSLYRWLVTLDPPRNAIPSEHASLTLIAILALLSSQRTLFVKLAAITWLLLIYWSTIATRQHVLIDLLAGAALGTLCWWWSGRRAPTPVPRKA